MLIAIDLTMQYQLGDDPMVLLAVEAARTAGQSVIADRLEIEAATLRRVSAEDGLDRRVWARVSGDQMRLRYRASVDVTRTAPALESLAAMPLHALPGAVVSCLRPSRFCQSDLFVTFAARRFGAVEGGAKIAAIRDWVARELQYVPGSSNATTTVLDTFTSREGVCRDYAHMVCALARAANIPARYVSAYGPDVTPQDFHAVAQVWLEGAWHLVDATGMSAANELVLVAVGRDACDTAFMETAAIAHLVGQSVTVNRQMPSER